MKKNRPNHFIPLLLLAVFSFFTKNSQAQNNPIQVTIIAPPPYPYTFSEYITRTGEPVLMLTNTDPFNNYATKIGVTITGDNGVKAFSNALKKPTVPIKLEALESKMLTGDEILDIYNNHNIDDVTYTGLSLPNLVQSQTIPEGIYKACVTVYDFDNDTELSFETCTPPIPILGLDPPIITNPTHETTVAAEDPMLIPFYWTPVAGTQVPILYKFRMVELPENVNPFDAMESDNFLIYDSEKNGDELMAPVLIYDSSFPQLEDQRRYAIQVTAYDPSGITLIRNEGRSDIVVFDYIKGGGLNAPVILKPMDGDLVSGKYPNELLANWTPVLTTENIVYDLYVAEVPKYGDHQAILSNGFPMKEVSETSIPYYQFLNNWSEDKWYAMMVKARSYGQNLPIANDGFSNVVLFQMTNLPEDTPTDPIPNDEPLTVQQYDCGEGCQIAEPNNATPIAKLNSGDEVRIGNFLMRIDQLTPIAGSQYNGKATILATDELPNFKVNLTQIKVNQNKEVYAGRADLERKSNVTLPINLQSPTSNFGLSANQHEDVFDLIEDLPTAENNDNIQAPYKPNEDYLITSIRFLPNRAVAKIVAIKNMIGDRLAGEKYLVFGKGNVCFSNGGLAEAGVELPLFNDVKFERVDDYAIHFQKANGSGGSFLPISCKKAEDMKAAGYVVMETSNIFTFGGNNTGKLPATFSDPIADLNNFKINLDFSNNPNGPNLANAFFQNTFAFKELEYYQFEITRGWLDHSLTGNGTVSIPTGARYTNRRFRGIFFSEMEVKTPRFIENENGGRLSIGASNFIFDERGFSGQAIFTTEECYSCYAQSTTNTTSTTVNNSNWAMPTNTAGTFGNMGNNSSNVNSSNNSGSSSIFTEALNAKIGKWEADIEEYTLKIRRSDLHEGRMIGKIKVPIFQEKIPFDTQISWTGAANLYLSVFDPSTDESLHIPMWDATVDLSPNSSMSLILGMMASVVLEASDPSLYNGRYLLSAEFNGGNFSYLSLSGNAHFMDDDYTDNYWNDNKNAVNTAQVKLDGEMMLDWSNRTFHGEMGYDINLKPNRIVYGQEDTGLEIHLDSDSWYLHIGTRDDRNQLFVKPSFKIGDSNYNLGTFKMNSYLQIGSTVGGIAAGFEAGFHPRPYEFSFLVKIKKSTPLFLHKIIRVVFHNCRTFKAINLCNFCGNTTPISWLTVWKNQAMVAIFSLIPKHRFISMKKPPMPPIWKI